MRVLEELLIHAHHEARRTEKKRFYQMAYASQKECQTILRLLRINDEKITSVVDHLGASVYKLMRSDLKHIEPDSRTG